MHTLVAPSKPGLMVLHQILSDSYKALPEDAWLRFKPALPVRFSQYIAGTNSQGAMARVFGLLSLTGEVVVQWLIHAEPRSSFSWVKKGDIEISLTPWCSGWFSKRRTCSSVGLWWKCALLLREDMSMWKKRPLQGLLLPQYCTSPVEWFLAKPMKHLLKIEEWRMVWFLLL